MYKRTIQDKLTEWKHKKNRKPLILRGARQVGKTTLVQMFAQDFDYFIHMNLEKKEDLNIFENNDNLDTIISALFLRNAVPSTEKDASILLFIDEIQNSPKTVALLRYFYEERNDLYLIAAGSLLESILDNNISFPVGRVEFLIVKPFSFREYLGANSKQAEIELLNQIPFPDYAHEHLLSLFKEYTLIGGMPEIVSNYIENKDLVLLSSIFDDLITTYMEDVEKYSKNENQTKIIRHIISNSVKMAGERIKFEGFAQSNYKSKDVGECLRLLEKTFFLYLVYPTTATRIPMLENLRKSPKLHVLDTGLINKFAGVQLQLLSNNEIDGVFEGKIAEHITGQELLSLHTSVLSKNVFWVKEKKQSNAELDYIIQFENLLIPAEVKLGKTGRLRSLMEFIDMAPHMFAVRIYSGQFSIEQAKTIKGKSFFLLNLPFYLISKIETYIKLMIEQT
jgi:predicted AAA+ superfamily ATPase